jgi:hypothetical protein
MKKKCAMTLEETMRPTPKAAGKRKVREDDDDDDIQYVGKGKRRATVRSDDAEWRSGVERRLDGIEKMLKGLAHQLTLVGLEVRALGPRVDLVKKAVTSLEQTLESESEEEPEAEAVVTEGAGGTEAETGVGDEAEAEAEVEAEVETGGDVEMQ